ncbi:hypothetical protein GGQ88_003522 [Novosphingobium hassiacum]|uniref:Uncharacterized protein n=1 Tax=Novosphingobium hassiacum TaxID=173676 RepID=A0A7W5ZZU6_9SPHN|nr:hypothetical protein [Novosphingobium hassiacum]MBB3862224.1 hypothetical protein [Novosphingobium hassiacum]
MTMHHSHMRGPVVPVTVFMQVSDFPDAATATQALQDAQQALDKAKARKAMLDTERAQRFPQAQDWHWRERWEDLNDYDQAGWDLRACWESLASVEKRMGLFHPNNRALLAGWVESAIGLLDNLEAIEGDPDGEEEELEDAFVTHNPALAMMDGDGRDVAWPEWHTRGRHKLARGGAEMANSMVHEDAEDDDPDSGVEDNPQGFDPETDRCEAGDDGCGPVFAHGQLYMGSNEDCEAAFPDYGLDQTQPGMPPQLFAEHAMMKPHLERARKRLRLDRK